MKKGKLAALALLLLASFSSAQCVLKMELVSPQNWAQGSTDTPMLLNFSVKNLSSGTYASAPSAQAFLGNGSEITLPAPVNNYYSQNFTPYALAKGQVGNVSMNASASGCVGANETRYFYVTEKKAAPVPDFNIMLLPLLAVVAIGIIRKSKSI